MRSIANSSTPRFVYGLVTAYDGATSTTPWDADVVYGCVCDSSWPVGYGNNSYQVAEYFGPACSLSKFLSVITIIALRTILIISLTFIFIPFKGHCPSGDNPFTCENEENCSGISQTGQTCKSCVLLCVLCSTYLNSFYFHLANYLNASRRSFW